MVCTKYYDSTSGTPLDVSSDGCELEEWGTADRRFKFARHPAGFLVFLPHEKLRDADEYERSDPYGVEGKIDNPFHVRRIESTLELLEAAVASLTHIPRILDVGCGQGHITSRAKQALGGAEVSGLDYSVSAIAYAHEQFGDIDFAVGDAYELPYADRYFDVVICNNLWEHVPDPVHLLKGLTRVLMPSGYLVVSTPSRYRLENLLRIMTGRSISFMSQHHVTEYSVGQVIEQLTYGGYEVVQTSSPPIPLKTVSHRIARAVFRAIVRMTGSHHQLESTVFFLARRRVQTGSH